MTAPTDAPPASAAHEPAGRSRIAAAAVVLSCGLGIAAALLAWILPAARGGAVSSLPGWVHTLLPVVSLSLCAVTAIRFLQPETPARGRHARTMVYAAAGAVLLQILRFSPFVPATFFLALSTGLGIGGGLLRVTGRRSRWPGPNTALALDLCLGVALLMLVGAETTLRFVAWRHPQPLFEQADAAPATRVARQSLKDGQLRFGFPANAAGFQDDPLPAAGSQPAPVVVLGDRSLWGLVPHHLAATTVAERALGAPRRPVVDLALPELGIPDLAWLCEQVALPLRPAAVVIAIDPYDELQRAALRNDGWRQLALLFDRRNVLTTSLLDRVLQRAALGRDGVGARAEAFRITEEVAPDRLGEVYPWLSDPTLIEPSLTPEALQRLTRQRAQLRFDERATVRRAALRTGLLEIADTCAARGVPCAVLLIPGADRIDPALRDAADPLRVASGLDDLFGELVAELRARGVPVLDATPALRAAANHSTRHAAVFQPGDLLVGIDGAKLLGDSLAALVGPLLDDVPPRTGEGR